MAQHKQRSRIAQFKQPFLLGAAMALGCGDQFGDRTECPTETPAVGSSCRDFEMGTSCSNCGPIVECGVDGVWIQTGEIPCNPPVPEFECPEERPVGGSSCIATSGARCSYADSDCPEEGLFICNTDGKWEAPEVVCNPPPQVSDTCPDTQPAAGESCTEFETGLKCTPECGPIVKCDDSGLWEVVGEIACNPPPLEDTCPERVLPRDGESCEEFEPGLECGQCESAVRCSDGTWVNLDQPECPKGPPPPSCPEPKPAPGETCDVPGAHCDYDDPTCPEEGPYVCDDGVWRAPEVVCDPPAPEADGGSDEPAVDGGANTPSSDNDAAPQPLTECPTTTPTANATCERYLPGLLCSDGATPCGADSVIRCDESGHWQAVEISCNPPPAPVDAGAPSVNTDGG